LTIISPSKFLARGLKGLCNTNVQVVPNFIDLGKFPYNPDSKTGHRLLWVRAFNAGYQPEIAVEALMQVRKSYPDASLTMIGPDKGTLPKIQEMISKYNLSDFVQFTGPVENTELYTYFHSHDVYLNTTAHESFGLAVFEAASCGLPIVSTRVGELPFIWTDGENIIFCSEQTGESFAQAIDLLFSDRILMDSISRAAELKSTEYQWDAVRPAWEKLFQI
ncbi:glycosyltransferase family 4 protein, partial [Akkermansiaceae bacterium]|nr:glycosyltransferase family 4 protein [Akkermansiaceae bacterium]